MCVCSISSMHFANEFLLAQVYPAHVCPDTCTCHMIVDAPLCAMVKRKGEKKKRLSTMKMERILGHIRTF